jgi:hypothetical protein
MSDDVQTGELVIAKTMDLSAVLVEPDGVLKATAIAVVTCENGDIGLLGLDGRGAEFVRAPLSRHGVTWLIGQLQDALGLGSGFERRAPGGKG